MLQERIPAERIAVGDKEFMIEIKAKLGAKAMGRRALENNEGFELRESQSAYNDVYDPEKSPLRLTTIFGKFHHRIQEHSLVRQEMGESQNGGTNCTQS